MADETNAPQGSTATAEETTAPAVDQSTETAATTEPVVTEAAKSLFEQAQEQETPAEPVSEKVVPEKYEFKLEGKELDQELVEAFEPLAKELNLSQDEAQKLVEMQDRVNTERNQRMVEAMNQQIDSWQSEVKKDPNWKSTVLQAEKAVNYGDEAIKELFSGPAGSHPEVIKWLSKVGQLLGEPTYVKSQTAPPPPTGGLRSVYKNSPELRYND